MKTTIEIHGYEIVVEETEEGLVSVSALKDGEVVEEFELEGGEDHPGLEGEGEEGEDLKAFGEEEDDLGEGEEDELGEEEDDLGEGEEDELGEEDEFGGEEEGKLESFNAFIRKRR